MIHKTIDRIPVHTHADCASTLRHLRNAALAFSLIGLLAACGSSPVDESQYSRVEIQIAEAKEVPNARRSGSEIYAAEQKLEQARSADKSGEKDRALRLLREAELHAQLAEARSLTAVQQKSLQEINAGLETLRTQIN